MSTSLEQYTAYVPCLNNAGTLRSAVQSVLAQSLPPAEVIVIDDGSTDDSVNQVSELAHVRIVRHETNRGRGAARARGMAETRAELVLCCDATNVLPPDFFANALPWFNDVRVAAVFGRISDPHPHGIAGRWRARHLFKDGIHHAVNRRAVLSTGGTIVRRKSVETVGGFNPALRHNEDNDLGSRLLAAGHEVVLDPSLIAACNIRNSIAQVLERYWRWYAGSGEKVTGRGYAKNIGYSIKAMAAADLRANDPQAVMVSLVCPHYQFWKSLLRSRARRRAGE